MQYHAVYSDCLLSSFEVLAVCCGSTNEAGVVAVESWKGRCQKNILIFFFF